MARDRAHELDAELLEIAERDMDVPLSPLGRRQSEALGHWMRTVEAPPDVVLCSPYVRAVETAEVVLDTAGLDCELVLDERLREREFGILDLLTRRGIESRFPAEAERRRRLGKFYHRPPGGESWVDVALRLRSLRDTLGREHLDDRVLMVTHEVVILLWRYLLERLAEREVLALGAERPIGNCALTTYVTGADQRLALDLEGWTAPLEHDDVPVTVERDVPIAPR